MTLSIFIIALSALLFGTANMLKNKPDFLGFSTAITAISAWQMNYILGICFTAAGGLLMIIAIGTRKTK